MILLFKFVNQSVELWLEVSPYLLLGMVIAGVLHVFLGKDFILRHLGRGGIASIVKATLLGIPLPVCSCGVIPIAVGLRKDGASRSAVVSFMVSTPTTGIDSILATYALLGPLFMVFRPLAALLSGIIVGLSDYWLGVKEAAPLVVAHKHQPLAVKFKIQQLLRYAFIEIPQDIGKWLLLGTLAGGLITILIPADFFSAHLRPPLDFFAALTIGIPLYVCATGSIPIAVSLLTKGFSPGAALVFLIVGPATNTIALYFVRQQLGKRTFYVYLFGVGITALILGIIFNQVWFVFGQRQELITGAAKMLGHNLKLLSGLVLFVLAVNGLFRNKSCINFDRGNFKEFKVLDIHCRHCRMTLENKLSEIPGVDKVFVDVLNKTVRVSGTAMASEIIAAIEAAGYHLRDKQ